MKNLSNFITESAGLGVDIVKAIKTIQTQDKIIMVFTRNRLGQFLYIWKGQYDKICAAVNDGDKIDLVCSILNAGSDDPLNVIKSLSKKLKESKYKEILKSFISDLDSSNHEVEAMMVTSPSPKLMDQLEDVEEEEI